MYNNQENIITNLNSDDILSLEIVNAKDSSTAQTVHEIESSPVNVEPMNISQELNETIIESDDETSGETSGDTVKARYEEETFYPEVPENYEYIQNELYDLLNNELEGRIILGIYKHEKVLSNQKLTHFIIQKLVSENPIKYNITANRLNELANQVVQLFFTADKKDWYRPATKNAFGVPVSAAGCLPNYYKRYCKYLRRARIKNSKSGDIARVIASFNSTVQDSPTINLDPLTNEDQTKYTIVEITDTWNKSFDVRSQMLVQRDKKVVIKYKSYVNTLKCLKRSISLDLLESDAKKIFLKLAEQNLITKDIAEAFSSAFSTNWPVLAEKICIHAKSNTPADVKEFRKREIQNKVDLDNVPFSILALFYLPHYLTKSTTVKNRGSHTFLREDISNHFVHVVKDESELEAHKSNFEKVLDDIGHEIHPYLVFCGTLDNISNSFVIFNGEQYSYKDPLKAVDSCFKACVALHTWSLICSPIWNYLQEHVYSIRQDLCCAFPASKQVTLVEKVIKKINNIKLQ